MAGLPVTGAADVAEYPQAVKGFDAELIVKAVML
jgi:hypothetical protein